MRKIIIKDKKKDRVIAWITVEDDVPFVVCGMYDSDGNYLTRDELDIQESGETRLEIGDYE